MDLSRALTTVLEGLVREPWRSDYRFQVQLLDPMTLPEFRKGIESGATGKRVHFVYCKCLAIPRIGSDPPLQGGALSIVSNSDAFMRASAELGEALIVAREFADRQLPSVFGLAGGIFAANAKKRALAECLEREAFFRHYFSKSPFERIENQGLQKSVVSYELRTRSDETRCALVVSEKIPSRKKEGCFVFGLGAGPDLETAENKAWLSFLTLQLQHALKPDWCQTLRAVNPLLVRQTPDDRHQYSKDPKVQELFRFFCEVSAPPEAGPRAPGMRSGPQKIRFRDHESPFR
ncbi:MAG: hypothetical protein AAB425_03150, partial [Bdellovibrionota bacterium]